MTEAGVSNYGAALIVPVFRMGLWGELLHLMKPTRLAASYAYSMDTSGLSAVQT